MARKKDTPVRKITELKRTKIVSTLGPATHSADIIEEMLLAGVDGFRLNFSHGNYEERDQQIGWIRRASRQHKRPVAIIQDLQGPKIRLGDFDGMIQIAKGQMLRFQYNVEYQPDGPIPTQYDLASKMKRGERMYLYDGRVKAIVSSIRDGVVYAEAENDGFITKRKGINLPDTDFGGDVLTAKDKKDIAYGAQQDIDYVAMSFVQTADDVKKLRRMLKSHNSQALVIAKIETKAAVENIDEIIEVSDGVMIARGDLAIETEPESVPIVQRMIIDKCTKSATLSIVATQMMMSMMESPEPTRAEVSDVATAVILGADCVMLSDETAMGKYPVQTISMKRRIIMYTQKYSPPVSQFFVEDDSSIGSAISSAVITLAHQVGAAAIVAETRSGATARSVAAHRPAMPIITVTSNTRVSQQLALLYGSWTFKRASSRKQTLKLTDFLREKNVFKKSDVIVIAHDMYPGMVEGTDTIKVRMLN